MRSTLGALAVAAFLASTAAAERPLLVHTTITRPNERGGTDHLNSPQFRVDSGKQGIVEVGNLIKFAITPELLKDGTARIEVLLISGDKGQPAEQFTAPPVKAVLGEPTQIQIGEHVFTTTVYLSADLPSQLGRRITLVGEAQSRKQGAAFQGPDFFCWVDGLKRWPKNIDGKRVSVTGTLIERHDLPVYVHRDGEPPGVGEAVPLGTDLREASHRFLLKDAKWHYDSNG
ncbi:hypothetical protein ACXR0O_28165 [Verrucomicrobiota bacterium sgz303538]